MPEVCSFRQVEEKHVSAEVACMCWSPKMDLLAVANVQGEVVLHRLSWQKVWTLAPPSENIQVTSLAWRPDGKVLAVGYNSGHVHLCDVENSSTLHILHMSSAVTSMTWVAQKSLDEEEPDIKFFQDTSGHFLPRLPNFNKSYTPMSKGQSEENVEDAKKLKNQEDLNILVIGTEASPVHMFAYGVFPVGVVDHALKGGASLKNGAVVCGHLSDDLQMLSIVLEVTTEDDNQKNLHLLSFDTTLLASRHRELRILALKFGQVLTLLMYLDSTIQQMAEAWEDILLEMDSKLLKFAEEKHRSGGGCVSNDFLRLLMFGCPSDELQTFLLHELTDKGLKKLGHSIETSYSNIQKLVLKHLQSVGQAIIFHLSDIRGMSHWYDKFGVLGLSPDAVQEAVTVAGSFMLKASELQQVIDGSMKNFKAFFRWLYVVIKGLSDEPVPPELSKMTQQDLNFVAQFLKENFTEEMNGSKGGFKLEKVGQYLKNEDLTDVVDNGSNPWVAFLDQNPLLQESPLLYPSQPNRSLVQMHEMLQTSIDSALQRCAAVIGQSLQCVSSVTMGPSYRSSESSPKKSRISMFSKTEQDTSYLYTTFPLDSIPCSRCLLVRQATIGDRSIGCVSLEFGEIGAKDANDSTDSVKCQRHLVQDLAAYDGDMLSALLVEDHEDRVPVLVQIPLNILGTESFTSITTATVPVATNPNVQCVDMGNFIDNLNYRRLENMKAAMFAVSGTRKVACVLFSSLRRVRLFLMDVEDEEEDEDEEEEADTSRETRGGADESREGVSDDGGGDENKENSLEGRDTSGMDL